MKTDWHIHTTASDGKYAPVEIVRLAFAEGFSQIAISDHDSLNGLHEIRSELSLPSMFVLPAVEFSVNVYDSSSKKNEVHILGYGLNPLNEELNDCLERLRKTRVTRFYEMIKKANELGFSISEGETEAVLEKNTAPGRRHLADILVAKEYFSVDEVFAKYLNNGKPGYVSRFKFNLEETCRLIRNNGGIAILAHPYEISSKEVRESLIRSELFDGIESFHPSHGENESEYLLEQCRIYNKYASGGSDYHDGESGRALNFPKKIGEFYPPSEKITAFIEWAYESPNGIKTG